MGTRVQLLECIFVFSMRLIEFDLFDSESDCIDIRIIVLSAPTVKL